MSTHAIAKQKEPPNQPLETAIQIGLAALLVIGCLMILRPFIPLVIWGLIIAVASYPTFLKLQGLMKGRGGLAAAIWTLLLLAVLIVPLVLLAGSLFDAVQPLAAKLHDGTLTIPPPPERVASWPLIGAPLAKAWGAASTNLSKALMGFAPQIKSAFGTMLSASAAVGGTVLQFLLAIVVSGVVLANAQAAERAAGKLADRLFGEHGAEFKQLVGATIRSVTLGILGVAFIQATFATAGFWAVGLPATGVWAVVFLFAAILQVGAVVLLPALIYVFAVDTTTTAVVFLVWCIIVALMDNVLKPMLLGRGVAVPVAVVFLGAIGGFVAMGIVGLFVGAIVLSVGYKLFLAWLNGTPAAAAEAADS